LNIAADLADHETLGRWAALGCVIGWASLLRQLFLLFVPFLLLWILWARRGQVRWLHVVVALLIVASMILPWTIRNYLAFDQFVLLNTNSGYVFFWANHPIHGTNFVSVLGPEHPSYIELIPPNLRHLNEAALEKALWREGLGFVLDDPGRYLLLSFNRLKDFFLFWPKADSSTLSNISRVGSFGLFLPFMVYGLFVSFPLLRRIKGEEERAGKRALLVLFLIFIVVYSGVHLLSWAYVRYRLPVDTVLVIFAAIGIYDLCGRLGSWRRRKSLVQTNG
jgi:4-amino-4-deoxy-L-arabinose transferase-like glycosyltransferase